jgi:ankyrin repeat protein
MVLRFSASVMDSSPHKTVAKSGKVLIAKQKFKGSKICNLGYSHSVIMKTRLRSGLAFLASVALGTGFQAAAAPADAGRATAMFAAIRGNDLPALKTLLASGADVNTRGERETTPLMYACAFGSPESVKLLLAKGADVNAQNAFGATALMWSVSEPEKVRLLLARRADVNAKSKSGRTAIMIAAMQNGSDAVFAQLYAHGARLDSADDFGTTFAEAAADGMNTRQLKIALARGLKVDSRDRAGMTPLMVAAGNGDLESVRLLISKGADVNAVSGSFGGKVKNGTIALGEFTALTFAAPYGPPSLVEELLRAGAKVDVRESRGFTPLVLALATEHSNPEIVRMLKKAGADGAVKSLDGETASDWEGKYSYPQAARIVKASFDAPSMSSAGAAAQRSLALLEKVSDNFLNTGGCVACHAQSINSFATGVAAAHGIPVSAETMKKHETVAKLRWASASDNLLLRFDPEGGVDHLDYGLFGLAGAGHKPDHMTDAMLVNLIEEQAADGGWHSGGIARAPMEDSDITRTAMSMRALQMFGWEGRRKDLDVRVARAHRFLAHAKPAYNEEFAMQLLGLKWAGDAGVSRAAIELASHQREDGGWSQNARLASDAYSTGQSLYALSEAGMSASDPVFERGVRFLLATQREDGSWHVRSRAPKFQPYFQSGFPFDHDQWISMAGTAWATMALVQAGPAK